MLTIIFLCVNITLVVNKYHCPSLDPWSQNITLFHFLFSIFFIIILLIHVRSSLLVLLVLRHKIIHVGLCLSELHLVHPLPGVPVEESLPPEHGGELLGDPLEDLLDGGGVTDKGCRHLESSWWNITDSSLNIIRDPLNKIGRVLVLHVQHLLVHLLHRHAPPEHRSNCEISAMARVTSRHHILGIKHLLGELCH